MQFQGGIASGDDEQVGGYDATWQVVRLFVARDKNAIPDDTPQISIADMGPGPHKLAPLLVKAGLAASNGEGTRKIKEGAVSIDGEKVTDFQSAFTIDKPTVLKLGRRFARLVP